MGKVHWKLQIDDKTPANVLVNQTKSNFWSLRSKPPCHTITTFFGNPAGKETMQERVSCYFRPAKSEFASSRVNYYHNE